jgi:hypothetical protein
MYVAPLCELTKNKIYLIEGRCEGKWFFSASKNVDSENPVVEGYDF